MENCSFYNALANDVEELTTDQLKDLQDLIECTIEAREKERVCNLRAKVIEAIKDYLNAGGGIDYEDNLIFRIDENPEDGDYYYIHLK